MQPILTGTTPVFGGILQSAQHAVTTHISAPVLDAVSRFGYHPDAIALTGSAAGGYAVARTLGGFITPAMYRAYEDHALATAPKAIESHERVGRFMNSFARVATLTGLGLVAGMGIPAGPQNDDYGAAFLYGAAMYAADFAATGIGVLLSAISRGPTLPDAMRLTGIVNYKTKGHTGRTWQLEDFLDRSSAAVERQEFILSDASLTAMLKTSVAKSPEAHALLMDKALMRAVNPDMPVSYRINLLRLIAVYANAAGLSDHARELLGDERLMGLLIKGPNAIKTAAHGVYVETLSDAGQKGIGELGHKLTAFYLSHRENAKGLASQLVLLPPVASALLDSEAAFSHEELFTRVENAVKDGGDPSVALRAVFSGPHQRVYVGYVDKTYKNLARLSPEQAGTSELKAIAFLRGLFVALNAEGAEKPFSPVAALKAALPYVVAGDAHVRAEAIRFQEEQAKQLNTAEKRQWHAALVRIFKSSDRRGLMRQPAPVKIEVLRFIARTAPDFKDVNNSADYDYTAGYLFDPDADVRAATAKTHLDLLTANTGDAGEETAYLNVLIARVVKVAKKGEPSEKERLRLTRAMEAVLVVFPALSDEGKKRVIRVLNTIEWGFTSEQFMPLADLLEPGAYNRALFDPAGRVQYARDAFAKFLGEEVSKASEAVDNGNTDVTDDTDGETLAKSLLDLKPEEIFAYVQERVTSAARSLAKPVPIAVTIAGSGLVAYALYKFVEYSRTEEGRAKIEKAPGGPRILAFIDKHMPDGVTPGIWARNGILRLPFGAKILGLIGTHVPFLANWATPPDLVAAAAESVIAPLVPTTEQIKNAVDKDFADNPVVPPVEAKPDADGDGGGGDSNSSPTVPEVALTTEGSAS
jgi:hypothetical protein